MPDIPLDTILRVAGYLVSEDGENTEYDRALVELICDLSPDFSSDDKEDVLRRIRAAASTDEASDDETLFVLTVADVKAHFGRPIKAGEASSIRKTLKFALGDAVEDVLQSHR